MIFINDVFPMFVIAILFNELPCKISVPFVFNILVVPATSKLNCGSVVPTPILPAI